MLSSGQASAAGSIDLAADPPVARAARVGGEQVLEHLARRGLGDRRAVIGPILEHDEGRAPPRPRGAAKASNLAMVRAGSRLQKAHCSTSIGSSAERLDRRLRLRPEPGELRARLVREAVEMPGRGEGGDAARRPELRGGERHRPAEAIADQVAPARRGSRISGSRIRSTWPATDRPRRSGPGQPQSSSSTRRPRAGEPAQQRALAHVEHVGRIDQRGHEQDRPARRRHNRAAPRHAASAQRRHRRRRRLARPAS